jgi:CubicO group peptidase (beta-lactamase class C family)
MTIRRSVIQGLLATVLMPEVSGSAEESLQGVWSGVLNVGSQRLRMKIELLPKSGTLISLDRDPRPVTLDVISLEASAIEFRIPDSPMVFRGALTAPDRIQGEWSEGLNFPFTLRRGEVGLDRLEDVPPLDQASLRLLRLRAGAPALAAMNTSRSRQTQIWVDGVRSMSSGVSVAAGDAWHLGSITKSITATLVARLVEAKKISWDDMVGNVLANSVSGTRHEYSRATYRHLLSHRAGLPKDISEKEFKTFRREREGSARAERLKYSTIALSQKPVGPLEKTFEYSNNDYVVAAAMLERQLGDDWETLVVDHVFAPLDIQSAGFGAPGTKGKLIQPAGHVSGDPPVAQLVGEAITDNPVAIGPAGTIHMNLTDLGLFLAAHRDESSFLSKGSWRTLHSPPFGGDYALGWEVRRDQTLWHGGSNTLWYAEVMVDKRRAVAAAAATNIANGNAMMSTGEALLRAMSS